MKFLMYSAIYWIFECYIFVTLFKTSKVLYRSNGKSLQPPPLCSTHLGDATAAILRKYAHHTVGKVVKEAGEIFSVTCWG